MATPDTLTPATIVAGSPGFTLLVGMDGAAEAGQAVRLDGNSLATTYVDADTLTATIPALDLLLPGERTISVADADGVDGGGGLALTVTEADPPDAVPLPWLPEE